MANALNHHVVVLHEGVDFGDGQVNQHTSDLGGKFGAANSLHVGEDARTDNLLVVGVLRQDSGQDRHGLGQVLNGSCILGLVLPDVAGNWGQHLRSVHGSGHLLSRRHRALMLSRRHALSNVHRGLAHVALVVVVLVLSIVLSLVVALAMLLLTAGMMAAHVGVLTGVHHVATLRAGLVAALEATGGSTGTALMRLVHALEVALLEQEAEQVHDLVRVLHLVEAARVLSLVALEILLILLHLVLHIAVLLDLVVVDVNGVVVDLVSRELSLGI